MFDLLRGFVAFTRNVLQAFPIQQLNAATLGCDKVFGSEFTEYYRNPFPPRAQRVGYLLVCDVGHRSLRIDDAY